MLDYPGGIGVYGAVATISKTDQDNDKNDYQATFNLKIEYTNQTQTDLDWELYMVPQKDDALNAKDNTICKLQQNQVGNQTQFWYADANGEAANAEGANEKSCSGKSITDRLTTTLKATKLASGKLKKGLETQTITKDSLDTVDGQQYDGELSNRVINTSTTPSKYYYLVVKYPNTGEIQNADAGKNISVTLKIDGEVASTLYTPAE